MMRLLLQLGRVLKAVPALAYAVVGVVTLAAALLAWHGSAVRAADAAGYARAVSAAHFDSTLVAVVDSLRGQAVAHTDTVRDTVRVRVERVRDVIVRVPDSVRVAVPVVDTLVIESRALAVSVDSLGKALDTERATATLALSVTRSALVESRLVVMRQEGEIATLSKRPKWRHVVGALGSGIVVGVVAMVAR